MQLLETSQNKLLYLTREDDYKECFSSSTNGIIHLDSGMRMKNLNREAERICGITRTLALGKRADVVLKKHGEDFLKIFDLSEYKDVKTTNLKLKINDQCMYVNVDSLRLLDSSGDVDGMIVVLQDVSAVRVAIKQIQTTQMLMSLGELAAGVAHHVRTPLTTISGYLQIMLGRLQDDQYTVRRDILETLLDEVTYINSVVKELILFAKPPIEKEPGVQINKLIDEALLLVFKQIGGEKISIKKQFAKALPVITADKNLIKQAVVNVIQNAIESMAEEGELNIKTWLNGDLNMLVIAINDTGVGVGSDILARVFEPFYTTKNDRMGLGLPITNRIVAEHGGFVNVSAGEISGTKVHIYIPIIDDRMSRLAAINQQILNLQ